MLILIVIIAIVAIIIISREMIVGFFLGSWLFFTNLKIFVWIHDNPWLAVLYATGYFIIGAVWSVVKWYFAEAERARVALADYAVQSNYGPILSRAEFMAKRKTNPTYYDDDIKWWIAFWPWSAVWTIANDPLCRIINRIRLELQGVYRRVTDYVWRER